MNQKFTYTKRILIACALEKELKVAKNKIKEIRPENLQVDFLVYGVGNIQTTLSLTEKLSQNKYDFVFSYGVCGYKDEKQQLIQIARSVYMPTKKEIISPVFFRSAALSSIACSETAISQSSELGDQNYVDMESYSFEKVCEHFRVPRLILKVPVDKIGQETLFFDQEKAVKLLHDNIDLEKIITQIQGYLASLSTKNDFSQYYEELGCTVSEKILLEKYIHKYESLSQKSFDIFFKEHKKLPKKNFFTTLSSILSSLSKL